MEYNNSPPLPTKSPSHVTDEYMEVDISNMLLKVL